MSSQPLSTYAQHGSPVSPRRQESQELLRRVQSQYRTADDQGTEEEGADDDAVVDDDFAETRAGRITAQHLWRLGGSATGEQALDIVRERAAEKKRKLQEKQEKAEQREAKRRHEVAGAIVRATELLERITSNGETEIAALNLKDLHALLQHADTGHPVPKGKKQELLVKVKALNSVVRALAKHREGRDGRESTASDAPPTQSAPPPADSATPPTETGPESGF